MNFKVKSPVYDEARHSGTLHGSVRKSLDSRALASISSLIYVEVEWLTVGKTASYVWLGIAVVAEIISGNYMKESSGSREFDFFGVRKGKQGN